MRVTKPLPLPSEGARQHSALLRQRMIDAMKKHGAISFRRYMEMALYEPGLGYYVAGKRKLGAQGDFTTAPELSAFFSQALANQCAQVLRQIDYADILELGAGSGVMAANILLQLESIDCLPQHYYILDLSPELKQLQRQTLERKAPHLLEKVNWLDGLPEQPINGVILGNEVLDAMPVELFGVEQGEMAQMLVAYTGEDFELIPKAADNNFTAQLKRLGVDEYAHYLSEFNPNLNAWFEALSASLQTGVVFLIDYGYTRSEYYHPDRTEGTLICHYQHLVHNDFFWFPGLQDITANVDFTHVAEAADNADFVVSGYTSQAAFLASNGLEELLVQALRESPGRQYEFAQQIRTLSLPSEMGERFKVIALSRHFETPLSGFSTMDFRHKL